MAEAEKRKMSYLFKLQQSEGVTVLMRRTVSRKDRAPARGGWQGVEGALRLQGRTRRWRVIVLKRALPRELGMLESGEESRQERAAGIVVMNPDNPM